MVRDDPAPPAAGEPLIHPHPRDHTMKRALITTFGLGALRPAPGTWGSLPPAAVAWLLLLFFPNPIAYHAALLAILAMFSFACLWAGAWAERHYHRKDPSHAVADETAGQCLPLMLLPGAWFEPPADAGWHFVKVSLLVAAAFLLFRFFDIVKPPPARGLQRLPGGAGILIDDLIAGVYAMAVMQAVTRLL